METKNRERLLLFITAGCLVLLLLNWLILTPLSNSWHGRADRIAQLRKSLADGSVMLRRQDIIRSRWANMVTNALPAASTEAERRLFNAFDKWVTASSVTEGSFKPQLKPTDDNYSLMECHAEVTGTYNEIVRFLYELEKDPTGLQIEDVDITSRDDSGQQISLGLDITGLLLPPTDVPVVADMAGATELVSNVNWTAFEPIANKNIFDPNRSGGRSGPRPRRPVVRTFTFCGVIDDVAIFKGDGVSSDGFLRAGDSVNGFKVMKIPAAYSENPEIKMTDPSGAIVALLEGQSMRREGEGSWEKSEQQASESSSSSDSSASPSSDNSNSSSSTPAASAPEPAGVSDILAKLRARHKQQDQ